MFHSLKNNLKIKGLVVFSFLSFGLLQAQDEYSRFLDSADYYINVKYSENKALVFLDSIPKPVENHIEGYLSRYYVLKALIHDGLNEPTGKYNSYILALKYANKEENNRTAGFSCSELFSILYSAKLDSLAFAYLEKAKTYYELCDYENGVLEVEQWKMYAKLMDGEHEASIDLLLKSIESYKSIEDDPYYYLFGLYMLTNNYLKLNDLDNAKIRFKEFKSLEGNSKLSSYNFNAFEVSLNTLFAKVYIKKNQNDKALYHLSEASKKRFDMSEVTVRKYLGAYADVFSNMGDLEKSKAYLDSLGQYEDNMFKYMLDSSLHINKALLETESELTVESEKKYFFRLFGIVVFGVLLVISSLYLIYYRKQKLKLHYLDVENRNLSHLKSTHEKLTVKVQGLEDYIGNMKNKVKMISNVHDVSVQKDMIKEFYRDLHLNSSTILDESNNHLDLVNDFNINFFNILKEMYPQLNDSEIIICYHIYIGFKNKEIALFLNTTVRAVESKRYRITKKLNFHKENISLYEFLKSTFPD
ncbi:hypothetical protein [Seonamhaeicola sp. ML3]|uniref:helix-turn-helix transcriptional regulator n=1 Tax=Seonamhaeicola sp. ML3 TaxID=2937786 RepID=UPI00200E9EC3|nr:hypothetical protein [Seonamhaeicola sp. ML3]